MTTNYHYGNQTGQLLLQKHIQINNFVKDYATLGVVDEDDKEKTMTLHHQYHHPIKHHHNNDDRNDRLVVTESQFLV